MNKLEHAGEEERCEWLFIMSFSLCLFEDAAVHGHFDDSLCLLACVHRHNLANHFRN
jgi:hypothetical protein